MSTTQTTPSKDVRGPLPGGWQWARLGDICQIIPGQSPPSETYRSKPGGLPFLQGKADFGLRHPVPRVWCISPLRKAVPGDILISVRAPVGPTNVADVECCIGRGLAAIRPNEGVDREFVLHALRYYEKDLARKGSGSTFQAISRDDLDSLSIPLPPLTEQRRIAAFLTEQMEAVGWARSVVQVQAALAHQLPTAYLRAAFSSREALSWPRRRLSDVSELLPSRSIATTGDVEVAAVTTACLTETGFDPSGIKRGRMWSDDAMVSQLRAGEVLVARSNTAELVGRAALYEGVPGDAVASDLTIRIWAGHDIYPAFLSAYLSHLYLTGYWRERAGGASDSMKKITRTQLADEHIPLPPAQAQELIVDRLGRQLAAVNKINSALADQSLALAHLPATLLSLALTGEDHTSEQPAGG